MVFVSLQPVAITSTHQVEAVTPYSETISSTSLRVLNSAKSISTRTGCTGEDKLVRSKVNIWRSSKVPLSCTVERAALSDAQ